MLIYMPCAEKNNIYTVCFTQNIIKWHCYNGFALKCNDKNNKKKWHAVANYNSVHTTNTIHTHQELPWLRAITCSLDPYSTFSHQQCMAKINTACLLSSLYMFSSCHFILFSNHSLLITCCAWWLLSACSLMNTATVVPESLLGENLNATCSCVCVQACVCLWGKFSSLWLVH